MSDGLMVWAIALGAIALVSILSYLMYREGYEQGYEKGMRDEAREWRISVPILEERAAARHDPEAIVDRVYPYRGEVD